MKLWVSLIILVEIVALAYIKHSRNGCFNKVPVWFNNIHYRKILIKSNLKYYLIFYFDFWKKESDFFLVIVKFFLNKYKLGDLGFPNEIEIIFLDRSYFYSNQLYVIIYYGHLSEKGAFIHPFMVESQVQPQISKFLIRHLVI